LNFLDRFSNNNKIQYFMKIHSMEAELLQVDGQTDERTASQPASQLASQPASQPARQTDRQTDMTNLIATSRNFANAPKKAPLE
jgi:hypothetical protein